MAFRWAACSRRRLVLQNWSKLSYNPIVNGSSKDPSAAWETVAGGEWRFSDNVGQIYSTRDWVSWRSAGAVKAFPRGDCPSLLPLPRTTPGSGPAPPNSTTPTHVHLTSGSPYKTWMAAGRYTDGAPGTAGVWEPLQPCAAGRAACGQCGDSGQTYAAKNFYDPVSNRTLLWTWAGVRPNATMALIREMTWNSELQQLQFSPIAEQAQLRGPVLAKRTAVAVAAHGEAWLASGANQSETSVVWQLPAEPGRFGVVTMGAGAGTSATTGGYFWIEYLPQSHSATVGYHSGGTAGNGVLSPALSRVMPGTNLRGMDLKVVSNYQGNWSQCQALCDALAACEAWTWCRNCPDTTKCCLKSGIPAPAKSANASMEEMVSGVKSPLLTDRCPMGANHSACAPSDTLRLAPTERTVSLRVFTDRTFAEAYWQGGRVVMTASTPPSTNASVAVASTVAVTAQAATVWSVKGIWASPDEVLATPRAKVDDRAADPGGYAVSVSTTLLRGSGSTLGVSVAGPRQNGTHFLGMFRADANLSALDLRYRGYCPPGGCAETTPPWTTTAPIKFWSLNSEKTLSSFSVHVVNYRVPLHFVVCDNALQEKCVGSAMVTFERMQCEPTGVHLARTATAGELRATWQSGEPAAAMRWRPAEETEWRIVTATTSTYTKEQMCGLPANMSIGWSDPGFIHTAVFDPGSAAAEYAVGSVACASDALGPLWSQAWSVAATAGDTATVMLVGDMGEAPRDHPGSSHHWQMPQPTEVVDAMTLRASGSSAAYDAILHVGDLSYATGYTSIWDSFMRQIEPLAAAHPYLTSPGNHERDSPGTGAFQHGDDSGGECGVPFNARFIMPAGDAQTKPGPQPGAADPRAPYYSQDVGPMQ